MRMLGKIAIMLLLGLLPIASGIVGYALGHQDGSATAVTAKHTWTDREIRATGTQNVGTLRCTYHLADGTVRVSESVIRLSVDPEYDPFGTPNPFGARTPDCPVSP
jgi:hypothetical protein